MRYLFKGSSSKLIGFDPLVNHQINELVSRLVGWFGFETTHPKICTRQTALQESQMGLIPNT
jgi:hypothetical protein